MPVKSRLLILFGLLFSTTVTVLIYWPGVHGGFALDDFGNIVHNSALEIHNLRLNTLLAAAFSSHSGVLYRPISMVSFALNEYFWGPAPYSMKATNIFIHATNGILVFVVTHLILKAYQRRFRESLNRILLAWTALAIATAWLLLPINLTAVLYVIQRMTSLSGTFVLIGVAVYLKARLRMLNGRSGFWLAVLGIPLFGTLAVLCKESGALLPLYTLVLEWTLFDFMREDGRRDPRLYGFYLLTLALPGIVGLVWMFPHFISHSAYANRLFDLHERLLTEARVVLLYISWSILPNLGVLSLYHDDFPFSTGLLSPPTTLLSIIGLVLLVVLAVWQRKKRPLISLGILWFLGGQLMTATVFPLELIFEQRNYLPDLGLLLILFSITLLEPPVERLALPRRAIVFGFIVLYAGITGMRVHEWSNPIRFSLMSAAAHPNSPRATYDLGRTYALLVNNAQSPMLSLATKALEHAAAVPHSGILPDSALLILHARFKLPYKQSWWQDIDNKLSTPRMTPQDINALTAIVNCSMKGCDFPIPRMLEVFRSALTHNAKNANLVTIYSNYVLNVLHDPQFALRLMRTATQLAPRVSQYWINLARLDIFLGKFESAASDISHLRRLNRLHHLDDALRSLQNRLKAARKAPRQPSLPPLQKGQQATRP